MGYFQPREIVDLGIRSIGKFRAQIQWVKLGRAGARFLSRREPRASPDAAPGQRLLADTRGVAAIEYAFLASPIAVSLVAALSMLGDKLSEHFTNIGAAIERALHSSYESNGEEA
jgi:Flp pilus assembly pilin Flp